MLASLWFVLNRPLPSPILTRPAVLEKLLGEGKVPQGLMPVLRLRHYSGRSKEKHPDTGMLAYPNYAFRSLMLERMACTAHVLQPDKDAYL